MKEYEFNAIETKWQKFWDENKTFSQKGGRGLGKYYVMEMFPYPSGKLHMGHVRNYSIGDAFARLKRMRGFDVLYPMGYDALGLPAENAAIKNAVHPSDWTEQSIATMMEQQKLLGLSYDWDRCVATCRPDYYRWNQWFFLKLLEKGQAYRRKAPINWCPECGTVLANEQVIDGACWRCESSVEIRDLEQWFLKITDYAEQLLADLDLLEGWPDSVKIMQRNWIGRSSGTLVNFVRKDNGAPIPIFTTRPDTLFGVTFMVYAPEHPDVIEMVRGTEREAAVRDFIARTVLEDKFTRAAEDKEKEGIFLGKTAINPLTGDEIPIYAANFVLYEYGTGAIMAVPTHDQRDFEFAKKYGIPLKVVINPPGQQLKESEMTCAYVERGVLVNSGPFDGSDNYDAKDKISEYVEQKGFGNRTIQYKLRDWLISRQRYWGTIIPIVYCDKCGIVPVPESELPVTFPKNVKFTGQGNPLANCEEFVNTTCPKCGGAARRETDTMDTFIDSSWYYMRYCSPKCDTGMFESADVDYWMPVDQYIGGIEHAILHLMYSRYFTKVMRDMGLVKVPEPFKNLLCQGMVVHETYRDSDGNYLYPTQVRKDGDKAVKVDDGTPVTVGRVEKMSKSKLNTIDPGFIIDRFGADTARIFILFASPPERELEWSDAGIQGAHRFLKRVWNTVLGAKEKADAFGASDAPLDAAVERLCHKTIKRVTVDIEQRMHFNTGISALMEFTNEFSKYVDAAADSSATPTLLYAAEAFVHLMSPFAPHMAEEMWLELGHSDVMSLRPWPEYDEKLTIDNEVELVVQVNGKVRDRFTMAMDTPQEEVLDAAFARPRVKDITDGKTVVKKIVVPNKLVNIVVK